MRCFQRLQDHEGYLAFLCTLILLFDDQKRKVIFWNQSDDFSRECDYFSPFGRVEEQCGGLLPDEENFR